MAPLPKSKINLPKTILIVALLLLSTGMIFGLTGGLQYIIPGFLQKHLSFEKVRPLHVSSVVFWIILGAMASVLTYMQEHSGKKIRFPVLLKMQLVLFVITILAILISYCIGVFGGREYWEFHPLLALPIIAGWVLFIINFIASIGTLKNQPVYVWMWLTGLIFFLFTFLESYLWIFPYFRNNVVNDMTIQWKSYGSMVGSWNMLIYGCSIFLMDKISGNKKYSYSGIAFALYFTGLFNLMFNWGHHVYTLPTVSYVKHIGYAVSMTEIILLGRIIYLWRGSLSTAKKYFYQTTYRFIVAADVWIFLTLALAICMSIPAINVYTHGTHITVGHTMGATIGINTMLLLAFAYDILGNTCRSFDPYKRMVTRGYWTVNISLFVFWLALIIAGVIKAKWQMSAPQIPFSSMMLQIRPYLIVFVIAGIFMMTGFYMIIYPLIKNQLSCYFKKEPSFSKTFIKKSEAVLNFQ